MADEWVVVRLKLQDKARFIADAKAAGASVDNLGRSVQRTGGLFQQGTHHGFLWNQMLFTLRRTIYGVTLATAALGAAAVVSGFHYNSMIEQQTLAFKVMLGNVKLANKEVTYLFNLAARGPFNFQQVISGARQLMAFQLTASRTNQVLNALQDAMAGMGLDQSQLERATLAIGQINASGRLLGQDLRQLEQLGLVNIQDMAKRLGVDPQQLASNAGSLGIPSKYAIDAIIAYWQTKFKGAAKQFQATWVGLTSTIKDYGSQMFGAITYPLFRNLEQNYLPRVEKVIQRITSYYRQQGKNATFGGALGVVDRQYGTNLASVWNSAAFAGRQLFTVLSIIVVSFLKASSALHLGQSVFMALGAVLWSIAHVLQVLQPILPVIIGSWILYKTVTYGIVAAKQLYVLWTNLQTLSERRLIGAKLTSLFVTKEVWDAEKKMFITVFANNSLFARFGRTVMTRMVPAFTAAAASAWAFTAALLANPITWIVVGVLALTAGLVVLYFKWKAFHDLVNSTFNFLTHGRGLLLAMFLPVIGPLVMTYKLFKGLYDIIRKLKGIATGGISWSSLMPRLPGLPGGGGDKHGWFGQALHYAGYAIPGIPGLASGGHVTGGGVAIVGERGPEAVHLPAGASVSPLNSKPVGELGHWWGNVKDGVLAVHIPLYLNSRQIAEANAEISLDTLARA